MGWGVVLFDVFNSSLLAGVIVGIAAVREVSGGSGGVGMAGAEFFSGTLDTSPF